MNVDTINIGHYRVTNNSGRKFDLFNRSTDVVLSITNERYNAIMEHQSVEMCNMVYDATKRGV